MKIKHIILFVTLLLLLVGTVSAEDISDYAGTSNLSETLQDSTVQGTDTLTVQTDEEKSKYTEKKDTVNVKSEEKDTVNSWNKLVDRVDSARNCTKNVTIALDEGTFTNTGTVYWESDNPLVLTIDGNGQSIDGNGKLVFHISRGSSLVLKNIRIENASSRYGAIYNEGLLTVINSTFMDNTGSSGGAICSQGSLTVNNSNFINNCGENGGAILLVNSVDNNVFLNSYFKNNTAKFGGAVYIYYDLERQEGDLLFDGNIFTDNSAEYGGAINLLRSAFITNNIFTNNSAAIVDGKASGGAIYVESFKASCVNLINNSFLDNKIDFGYGGGVYVNGYSSLNSYNDTFINNAVESDGFGGALYSQVGVFLNVSHGTFINNRATWAGAIFSDKILNVNSSEFIENRADYGGSIASFNALITVNHSLFKDSYANRSGGAIGVKYDDGYGTSNDETSESEDLTLPDIIIENCEFRNVSSRHNGGAICFSDFRNESDDLADIMMVKNSTFTDCKSEYGGAILKLNGNLTIINSVFDEVNAVRSGGAVYTSCANLGIINSSFTDYTANTDGKVIYFDKGLLSISGSLFYDNEMRSGKSSTIHVYDSSIHLLDSYFNNPESSVYGVFVNEYNIKNTTLREDKVSLNNTDYVTAAAYQGKQPKMFNYTPVHDIPPSYDLRDYGLVTSVKDQQYAGACMAFADIAAIESALLKQTKTEYDFSEYNMYSNILGFSKYGFEDLFDGSIGSATVGNALSWIGVIPEEYDEYDSLGMISGIIDTEDKIRVQDVMFIFSDTPDRDKLIKEAILNYGAVTVNINETYYDECWNPETNSLYNPYSERIDHALIIVGWDDDYSKENFMITPPGDGAWILKNSWGTRRFDKGYLYVSYYDKSFNVADNSTDTYNFCVYIFNNTINYKTNYQTDLIGLYEFDSNYTYYSNTYTAYYNESLAAVGTYFNESGVNYEIKIYVNGKHVLTQNGTSNFAGYKTIILDKYIPVNEGDTFTVVFKNNNVPTEYYSRQHYMKNVSSVSVDGETWEDISEDNQTVCLKVYTVETTEDNDTNDMPAPQPKPVRQKVKHVQTHKTIHNNIRQTDTYTIRLSKDNTTVYTGYALTLEALNRIFDHNFTNGHLLVYVDGVLVFNQTTTDDISQVILEIMDKYLGEHEIKVVFTDIDNHTDTYKENITIG